MIKRISSEIVIWEHVTKNHAPKLVKELLEVRLSLEFEDHRKKPNS